MSKRIQIATENQTNFKRSAVSTAVHAATSAILISVAIPSVASAQLEEIIVTASKRAENLQDVAVSVIAFDSKTLNDVGITNFDDYVRYQPNLTASGRGPVIPIFCPFSRMLPLSKRIRSIPVPPTAFPISSRDGSLPAAKRFSKRSINGFTVISKAPPVI